MTVKLAPRPANEEQRVKAVIKTGLIDAPDNTAFQVYCELAKDITGFDTASFSLFDADMQCKIANVGDDDYKSVTEFHHAQTGDPVRVFKSSFKSVFKITDKLNIIEIWNSSQNIPQPTS